MYVATTDAKNIIFRTVSVSTIRMRGFTIWMRFNLDYDDDRFRPLQCDRKGYRSKANDNQWRSSQGIWNLAILSRMDCCTFVRMGPVREEKYK